MPVLDYRPFSHRRDEMDHLVGPRPRGERRRNSRRAHRRKIKRLETRTWRLDEALHQTAETN